MARVGGEAENISLVVKFDELNRNGRVLQDPVEKSFLRLKLFAVYQI